MNEVRLDEFSQKIFGISPRHYRRLAQEGHVPVSTKGRIPLLAAIRDLLIYYRKRAEQVPASLESAKLGKLEIERKLGELKFLVKSRELILTRDIPEMVRQRDRVMKNELNRFQKRLLPRLIGKDVREMGDIVGDEVYRTLNRISVIKKRWKSKFEFQIPPGR